MATSDPSLLPLSDPEACGEDLAGNVRGIVELAAAHCPDCADYHVVHQVVRLLGDRPGPGFDRAAMIAAIAHAAARSSPNRTVHVFVAGSADTAQLATAAHAIRFAAGRANAHFAVADRCGTPLALCERFAARHGLTLATREGDLTRPLPLPAADVVVVHSLLRALPAATHAGVLRRLAEALGPGGRIVFSHGLHRPKQTGRVVDVAKVAEEVAAGRIELPEPMEQFAARVDRLSRIGGMVRSEYDDEAPLVGLFARSGLTVEALREVSSPDHPGRRRVVAVLARQ